MGHAIYDPGQEDRPAWNVGRKLGAKRPLLPKQVWAVRFFLEQEHLWRWQKRPKSEQDGGLVRQPTITSLRAPAFGRERNEGFLPLQASELTSAGLRPTKQFEAER